MDKEEDVRLTFGEANSAPSVNDHLLGAIACCKNSTPDEHYCVSVHKGFLDALIVAAQRSIVLATALEDMARRIEARSELYTSDSEMYAALIAHCRTKIG